jgi:hypothetical protein
MGTPFALLPCITARSRKVADFSDKIMRKKRKQLGALPVRLNPRSREAGTAPPLQGVYAALTRNH